MKNIKLISFARSRLFDYHGTIVLFPGDPMSDHTPWPRAIIHIDMNAFFASIEQLDRPELRGRPIGVTNGKVGTCIITSSYEARAHGIKTGMRVKEALRLCPEFIQVPARPERYVVVSTAIMDALNAVTPDLEVFSVDEAFLDVTHCQSLLGPPEGIAERAMRVVSQATGLPCSRKRKGSGLVICFL